MSERRLGGVLSFVNEPLDTWVGETPNSRQPAIDGTPIRALLPINPKLVPRSPLFDKPISVDDSLAYLRSLIGGPSADELREGRIGLLFCASCLDSSCGTLLAGDLAFDHGVARWMNIGFEEEHFWSMKRIGWGPFKRNVTDQPPAEWWTPQPFDPPIVIEFDEAQYRAAVASEIDRTQKLKEST